MHRLLPTARPQQVSNFSRTVHSTSSARPFPKSGTEPRRTPQTWAEAAVSDLENAQI